MRNAIDIMVGQGLSRKKGGKCLIKRNEVLRVLAALRLVLCVGYFKRTPGNIHNINLLSTAETFLPNHGSRKRASRLQPVRKP